MAITVEYLTGLGIEKDTAAKIFAERGEEIQAEKEKAGKMADELKTANQTIKDIQSELDTLKNKNASAEEWENKYKELDKKVKENEAQALKDKQEAEKIANLTERFEKASLHEDGSKRNWHELVKEGYKNRFFKEIEKPENQGKSDADIFKEMTQNDAHLEYGIQTKGALKGANPIETKNTSEKALARAVMGLK